MELHDSDTMASASESRREARYALTPPRNFFAGFGLLCTVVAIVGFSPNVLHSFTGGPPIPAIVYVHGAAMFGWLLAYTAQAVIAGRGNLSMHRKVGVTLAMLAALVWLSMGTATIVALRRFDPDKYGFIVQPLLIQLGQMTLFPIFVLWGVLARRHHPGWHKRLMTFATLVLLQSALDRMHWLPNEGLPMFWHAGLRLYVLMIPIFIYDIVSSRRVNPATWTATGLIVGMHAVVSTYWENPTWHQLARSFWSSLRS